MNNKITTLITTTSLCIGSFASGITHTLPLPFSKHRQCHSRRFIRFVRLLLALLFVLLATPITTMTPPTAYAATDCATQTDVPQTECEALLALYQDTNGENWTNNTGWGQDNTICSWYGVTCANGSVQALNLSSHSLSGSIPAELGNLANLQYLDLIWNGLSGSIPAELGNLTHLQTLDLGGNDLSGYIPAALGNLANLQSISLWDNKLSGSIPPELGNLANLQTLSLNNNQLSGSIPAALGNLANLQSISLWGNILSGSIPPELGNLANLQTLSLNNNQLSGSIPTTLVNLTNISILWLSDNYLDTNVTDQALLDWLNAHDSDWRNQYLYVTVNSLATSDAMPMLTGKVNYADATVQVTVHGQVYTSTTTLNNTWSVSITNALAEGTYDVVVQATNAAGTVNDTTVNELKVGNYRTTFLPLVQR